MSVSGKMALVVKMLLENGQYKADLAQAVSDTQDAAAKVQGSAKGMEGGAIAATRSFAGLAAAGAAAFAGSAIVRGAVEATKAMFEASAGAERLRTMLDFSTGANGAREIEYLRSVTNRLGLEFAGAAKAYGQFQAAAKGTALEGDKARAVFESVAKASAVMGLSAADTSGVLLALQQMISKGTVQAEELRGQLGERLPGAFQIAAKAMGVTTAELGKMLEQGQVIADDFLPKFGAALETNLGGAAEKAASRLDAAVNRFGNAWERLKQTAGDSGLSKAVANELGAITRDFAAVADAMENTRKAGGGMFAEFGAGAGVAAGRVAFSTLNLAANSLNGTINLLTGGLLGLRTDLALLPDVFKTNEQQAAAMSQRLKQAQVDFAELQKRGDVMGGNIYYRSEMANLAALIKELKAAQAEREKLAGSAQPNMNAGVTASGRAREQYNARRAQDQASADALRLKVSGVPDSYVKEMSEVIRLNQAGVLVGKEYTQTLKQMQAELLKKTGVTTGADAALADALSAQGQAYKNADALILKEKQATLDELARMVKMGSIGELDAAEQAMAAEDSAWEKRKANFDAELAQAAKKKNSAAEVARITGQADTAEAEHQRTIAKLTDEATMAQFKQQDVLDAIGQKANAARAAMQGQIHDATLDAKEIGVTGAALGELTQRRMEDAAAALEQKAVTLALIDPNAQAVEALRAQAQAMRDLYKVSGNNGAAQAVYEYGRAIKEQSAATAFELSLMGQTRQAREVEMEQYRIEIDLLKKIEEIKARTAADPAKQAQLIDEARASAAIAKANASSRVFLDEWKQSVDKYDDIFRQGFADMLNSGKDGWKSFTKSLATTFKTTVADTLYKAFAQPFVVRVVGSLLGLTGLGSAGSLLGTAGGSNILGLASNASSLYSAATGNGIFGSALNTVGGWLGFGGSAAATGLGLSAATGAGVIGSGIGAGLGLGSAAAGTGLGLSLGGTGLGLSAGSAGVGAIGAGLGTSAAAGGTAAAGAGVTGALAAVPVWGWALAAVAALGVMLSKKQTLHSGAGAIYNSDTGLQEGAGIYNLSTFGMGDVREYNKEGQSLASGIATGLGATLDGLAKTFGQKAGFEVATAFADDTSKDGAWGSLRISKDGKDLLNWDDTRTSRWAPREFADGEAGQKEYLAAIAKDTRQVLLDMDLPAWADTLLINIGEVADMEKLSAAVAQIGQAQAAFEAFGQYMPTFGDMADSARSALVKASGGIAALTGNMATFVDNFYTDGEKLAVNTDNVRATMAALGFEMPTTRDGFKALVQAQIALGDAGAKALAGLLGVSGAFASITAAAVDTAQTAADLEARQTEQRDKAFRALERAVSAEQKRLQTQLDAANDIASAMGDLFTLLHDNVRDLYSEVDATRSMYASQGSDFIARALEAARSTGYLPDEDKLSEAIGAVRGGFGDNAATSQFQRDRDRLVLAGQLAELEGLTGKQLTSAERTVRELEAQSEQLDQTLDYWKEQIDIANGTYEATLSVVDAIKGLESLMFPDTVNLKAPPEVTGSGGFAIGGGGGGGSPSKPGSGFYGAGGTEINDAATVARLTSIRAYTNTLDFDAGSKLDSARDLAAQANERGVSATDIAIANGYRVEDVERLFAEAGVHVPRFDVGTNYVPRDMLAQIHEGEAIVPKAYNPAANPSMAGHSDGVIAELRALREAVAQLRAAASATASNTTGLPQLVDQFDNVTTGGQAMREVAA